MSSTRKTRKVNKRFAKVNEDWPDKDGPSGTSSKTRNRKKKLVDMLGPQWSKEELERFYDSYRKYGKDWRKVGGAVRNRTSDMAEALYNMNRAYLSLPEGAATAAGLIAMMTDHYSHLDGSNSENESPESAKATTSVKQQHKGSKGKGKPAKVQEPAAPKPSKPPRYPDLLQYEPASSSFSALSALKKRQRSQSRAVGKRTPRVAVGRMYNRHYNKVGPAPGTSAAGKGAEDDEEEGAHVAAMALAHVFHHPSPIKSGGEGSLGSREAENENEQSPAKRGGGGKQKRRSQRRKQKGPSTSKPNKSRHHDDDDDDDDDDKGACSGTDEGGRNTNSGKRRSVGDASHNDNNNDDEDDDDDDFGSARKRNRQLFFGDENESSALDALHTLADLSVNILQPTPPIAESESSSGHEKAEEEKQQGKRKTPVKRDKRKKPEAGGDAGSSKRAKKGDSIASASETTTKPDINNTTPTKPDKAKRRKATPTKRSKDEAAKVDLQKGDEEKAAGAQASTTPSKAIKYVLSSSSPAQSHPSKPPLTSTITSTTRVTKTELPPKRNDPRKSGIVKAYSQTPPRSFLDNKRFAPPLPLPAAKENLSRALSSSLFRRWCKCEWFYSAIDYPWFMQSEFVEYLNHVKLGHIPRLTRVEWGVIRSSLGKARRLSHQFLKSERAKLDKYRESARAHYYHLKKEPRALSVGQRVVACHPKSRELHDGTILVVYRDGYRVQFDRPHLSVEKVQDIDCMPIYSPHSLLTRPNPNPNPNPLKFAMRPQPPPPIAANKATTSSHPINTLSYQAKVDTIDSVALAKACVDEAAAAAQQSMYNQPCTLSQIQEREADIRALDELKRALEKKEALLMELRNMNDDVSGGKNMNESDDVDDDDDSISSDNDHFRKQYAMVLLQLRDANDQVATALLALRQRNTYMGNPQNAWARSTEAPSGEMMLNNNHQEDYEGTPHQVVEIMDKSRRKAKMMVDTAVQAMCGTGEGEDALVKIGEALDALGSSNNNRIHNNNNNAAAAAASSGSSILGIRRIPPSDSAAAASCANNISLPCDLISSCVSTLLMIQSCTERQHPPAEVAHILDSALLSMQPCCPENQPIFREIETCIGIIKNQMLALIPTPTL